MPGFVKSEEVFCWSNVNHVVIVKQRGWWGVSPPHPPLIYIHYKRDDDNVVGLVRDDYRDVSLAVNRRVDVVKIYVDKSCESYMIVLDISL